MRVSTKRWNLGISALTLVGLTAALGGVYLRWLGEQNISTQDHYLSVRYSLSGHESIGNIGDPKVDWLSRNNFFLTSIAERPWLTAVRQRLPELLSGRYFSNVWQLLLYVEYFGDSEDLFLALKASIEEKALLESGECIDYRQCNIPASANVTSENAALLFELLNRAFIQPALQAYGKRAYADSAALAHAALAVARMVDLDPRSTDSVYDKTLVLGAFLTRPESIRGETPFEDFERVLNAVVNGRADAPPADPEMATYHVGLSLLRKGCYRDASDLFASAVGEDLHGPVNEEPFAFMSLRAAATPFIRTNLLKVVAEGEDRKLVATDCEEEVPSQGLAGIYHVRADRFSNMILHPGLASDAAFFSTKVPTDDAGFERLQFLVVAAESENEGPTSVDPVVTTQASLAPAEPAVEPGPATFPFDWPVIGTVVVQFAESKNTGINIEAPEDHPVLAAEGGEVIYVGSGVEGYGNLVLIRHSNGYVTAYAHLGTMDVEKGDKVLRGKRIATLGMTGSVSRPTLHFELRNGPTPVDPIPLLAGAETAAADGGGLGDLISILFGGDTDEATASPDSGADEPAPDSTLVRKIQTGLASLGFYHGAVNGTANDATKRAIREFENFHAHPVTGAYTPDLVELLISAGAVVEQKT